MLGFFTRRRLLLKHERKVILGFAKIIFGKKLGLKISILREEKVSRNFLAKSDP